MSLRCSFSLREAKISFNLCVSPRSVEHSSETPRARRFADTAAIYRVISRPALKKSPKVTLGRLAGDSKGVVTGVFGYASGGIWRRSANAKRIIGTRKYSDEHALCASRCRAETRGNGEIREISRRTNNCSHNDPTESGGHYKSHYTRVRQLNRKHVSY